MMCTCQECGRRYALDLNVTDEVWEEIKPKGKPEGGGLLCCLCILERLAMNGYKVYHLEVSK